MTREEKLALLEQWRELYLELEKQTTAFCGLVGGMPDSPLMTPVWQLFDRHTELLSRLVGDASTWLNWYWWECSMGREPNKAKASEGDDWRAIETIEDLLWIIEVGK